ncbi:IS1/IS1595 family N-terminal zinc-binding domain-containing protein [Corynebacterium glucuronolyticum]|uniref:IS1/IS1595 family N-terminal zinc-binding domain-containing protein n=1 Tax=Corynebacterium glucuronolyticum TaxID=39791 RepID=UPI003F6DE0F6
MSTPRPYRPVCHGPMKRNGKTAKGTPRWRCKNPDCGASTTKSHTDAIHATRFRVFMDWIMGTRSLDQIAASHKQSLRTLTRWFKPFWAVQIPDNTDCGDP